MDNKTTVNIKGLDKTLWQRARADAFNQGITIKSWIVKAIEKKLEEVK